MILFQKKSGPGVIRKSTASNAASSPTAGRKSWDAYESACEDVLEKCSTEGAPWLVIPSDHKWFRNLAISQIIVETMENLGIRVPEPSVDIGEIRSKYHGAVGRAMDQ